MSCTRRGVGPAGFHALVPAPGLVATNTRRAGTNPKHAIVLGGPAADPWTGLPAVQARSSEPFSWRANRVATHVAAPPDGLLEVNRARALSVARHTVTVGQTIRVRVCPGSIVPPAQLDGPSAGARVTSTLPPSSPATHSDTAGQAIAWRLLYCPIPDRDQASAPPLGSAEVSTSPRLETTTHNELDAHESPVSGRALIAVDVQAEAPPVGLLDVTTSPASSNAAQNDTDGHEIRNRW